MGHPEENYIHPFDHADEAVPLPCAFTYPFHYTPHPLVISAARKVQEYIASRDDWHEEIEKGKMFGVLIVSDAEGTTGFLAAFSGNLAGSNRHGYFVPPVYDLLQPDGFFRKEEEEISAINRRIEAMEQDSAYLARCEEYKQWKEGTNIRLGKARARLKEEKDNRNRMREKGVSEEEEQRLVRESQFQKAEYKRLERRLKAEEETIKTCLNEHESTVSRLKQERKSRSAALQLQLFKQFRMLNANGEAKDLCELFKDTPQRIPPAGAGECALPKLLQFAYLNHLRPLAMGEFWWGMSPKDEIRHHGHFYPSCTGKCGPILRHMLIGLKVEKNPMEGILCRRTPLNIVYEDEWLVVIDKPAGMLSVPGNGKTDSVCSRLRECSPHATGPLVVHRLDMATSGLILAAKDKETHRQLQSLFETRKIRKRYTAILEGEMETDEGRIELPLCPNPLDRPRQMADKERGKPSVTLYKVRKRENGNTWVDFYPLTGRTHQIRVHAAHPQGLDHPVVGDELYGHKADRMYLHAAELDFIHPATHKELHIVREADFLEDSRQGTGTPQPTRLE